MAGAERKTFFRRVAHDRRVRLGEIVESPLGSGVRVYFSVGEAKERILQFDLVTERSAVLAPG